MKKVFGIVLILVFVGAGFFYWSLVDGDGAGGNKSGNSDNVEVGGEYTEEGIVYFYRYDCSHCRGVLSFMEQNNVEEKIEFKKKEIHNNENRKQFSLAAMTCGLNPGRIGVPFVYADGKCYMGDKNVIDFFRDKIEE